MHGIILLPLAGMPCRYEKEVNNGSGTFTNQELFRIAKGDPIEFPILMSAFYGLRRSEIMGLRWQAIDFEGNTITINHTVMTTTHNGKAAVVQKDRTKNKASCRSMPLVPQFRSLLLHMRAQQEENQKLCGNCYKNTDYIYVNALGEPYNPNYVTNYFKYLLHKHGLRHIRFHDLRHPYVKARAKIF